MFPTGMTAATHEGVAGEGRAAWMRVRRGCAGAVGGRAARRRPLLRHGLGLKHGEQGAGGGTNVHDG